MDGKYDLEELAEALRELHRCLVERLRREHERECGAVVSAAQFLPPLTSDARFAWLHLLAELIVDVEVFLKADPSPTEDDCAALRAEFERLLVAPRFPESASVFAQRLPQAGAVDEAAVLHERHGWAEARRHRHPAPM